MALTAGNAWRLEDDRDATREAIRKANLNEAYARERQGYLDRAEHAPDEAEREKWSTRAQGVTEAAANDGVPLPAVRQQASARR